MAGPSVSYAPLWINQGDTFIEIFTWLQANGSPVDLTSYTAQMHVQQSAAAGGALLDWSANVVLGGTAGTAILTDVATLTAGYTVEVFGYYNLRLTSASGQVTRVWEGAVYVSLKV